MSEYADSSAPNYFPPDRDDAEQAKPSEIAHQYRLWQAIDQGIRDHVFGFSGANTEISRDSVAIITGSSAHPQTSLELFDVGPKEGTGVLDIVFIQWRRYRHGKRTMYAFRVTADGSESIYEAFTTEPGLDKSGEVVMSGDYMVPRATALNVGGLALLGRLHNELMDHLSLRFDDMPAN